MAWLMLIVASVFEISWAIGLKYSEGLTKPLPSVFTVVTMILSFVFLSQAAKHLPIGTAYVIWTGIGAAGTAFYGMMFFNESREVLRIVCLLVIISGVIGLKLTSSN